MEEGGCSVTALQLAEAGNWGDELERLGDQHSTLNWMHILNTDMDMIITANGHIIGNDSEEPGHRTSATQAWRMAQVISKARQGKRSRRITGKRVSPYVQHGNTSLATLVKGLLSRADEICETYHANLIHVLNWIVDQRLPLKEALLANRYETEAMRIETCQLLIPCELRFAALSSHRTEIACTVFYDITDEQDYGGVNGLPTEYDDDWYGAGSDMIGGGCNGYRWPQQRVTLHHCAIDRIGVQNRAPQRVLTHTHSLDRRHLLSMSSTTVSMHKYHRRTYCMFLRVDGCWITLDLTIASPQVHVFVDPPRLGIGVIRRSGDVTHLRFSPNGTYEAEKRGATDNWKRNDRRSAQIGIQYNLIVTLVNSQLGNFIMLSEC
jgi:hypothetical protein